MTLACWDDVAAFALTLPATVASTSHGQPAIKTRGRLICSTGHEPDTFWQTAHYENCPDLLVRYGGTDPDRLRTVITRAWWDRAATAQQTDHGPRP